MVCPKWLIVKTHSYSGLVTPSSIRKWKRGPMISNCIYATCGQVWDTSGIVVI